MRVVGCITNAVSFREDGGRRAEAGGREPCRSSVKGKAGGYA